jgi:hypothetical protein
LGGGGGRAAATVTATVTNGYGFDTSQANFFQGSIHALKRTSIDFYHASFVDHSKSSVASCDSFPATTTVTAGSIASPV